jgi:thymidine kinase
MAKLIFRYGAMGASKTVNALMVAFNYKERNQFALVLKPEIDSREGTNIIRSRCGIQSKVELIKDSDNILDLLSKHSKKVDCVIVDESQFLSKKQIEQLTEIVDDHNIPVICYGLRVDFKGDFFEGSKWLMCWADTIEEIKTICWCGKKATFNARLEDGKVIKHGEKIQIGGNETYISLCRKHWKRGETKGADI